MKTRTHQNQTVHRALLLAALVAGTFLAPALRAQPAARKVDSRFLLIFDTSSDMKRRLPAVQKALNTIMLTTGANGQLQPGDSIGVWTFDQYFHAGQFPLQHWMPDNAAMIASNLTAFVGKQRYAKTTDFDALAPLLNQVVRDSERLTVLIFCDGKGEIHGTPYDGGINQIFQQRQAERQKARLPIVIGLRSQLGQYVGCMVSFPPEPVSLSAFPPLPEAIPAPPPVANVSAPSPPRPKVPPLIIIGPKPKLPAPPQPASTNLSVAAPLLAGTNQQSSLPVSSPAAAPIPEIPSPQPPEAPGLQPTNLPPPPPAEPKPSGGQTNAAAAPAENSTSEGHGALIIGVALLALAGGLVIFMRRCSRTAPPASLITRSMNEDKKNPPPQT